MIAPYRKERKLYENSVRSKQTGNRGDRNYGDAILAITEAILQINIKATY